MAKGKATPIEVKRLAGTVNVTRERLKNEIEPETIVVIPDAPHDLGDLGRELWVTVCEQQHGVGILYPSTLTYIHAYCRVNEMHEEAAVEMAISGKYETDPKTGRRVPSAAYKVFRETLADIVMLGAKLGLSPVDKTKVSQSISMTSTKDKNQIKRIGVTG